ncbi:MAG: motility protein A, partial [Oscillospiraceae bacterium]
IVEYAQIARTRGLLALEESANQCTDPFMKSALMLIVDANEPEKVRAMLDDSIGFMVQRHELGRAFFERGVGLFPAFGMLGTLVGLINMLASMNESPDGLAIGMAQALITTFYGSLFANVIFAPLGMSLQNSHEDELLCMQIIEEGVLAIAAGSNPRYIQEKLEFMLPKSSIKHEGKS